MKHIWAYIMELPFDVIHIIADHTKSYVKLSLVQTCKHMSEYMKKYIRPHGKGGIFSQIHNDDHQWRKYWTYVRDIYTHGNPTFVNGYYGTWCSHTINLAFSSACRGGHLELVKSIWNNSDDQIISLNSKIYTAAKWGHTKVVKYLVRKHPKYLNDAVDGACRGGHLELLNKLPQISCYQSALEEACRNGRFEIIQHLVSRKTKISLTAFRNACQFGNLEIVKFLMPYVPYYYSEGLCGACRGGHLHIAKYMIELGGSNFDRALKFACMNGYLILAKYMIECGATDIQHALWKSCDHPRIIEYLVSLGAHRCECKKCYAQ